MPSEEKDYIDVGIEVRLQADQLEYVEKNPEGLTIEGCEQKVRDWKRSNNRLQLSMYEFMLKKCKNFAKSGKTVDDRIIYARDNEGKASWLEPPKSTLK